MKIKYVVILAVCAVVLASASVWYYITRNTQSDLSCVRPLSQTVVEMPLGGTPISVELAPGLRFKFDTGADISSISDADLDRLRKMGYKIEESSRPIVGRNGYGATIFSMRRYTVSLPVGGYERFPDSTGVARLVYSGKPTNVVCNVDFAPAGDGMSSLGLDVLKRFKLECCYKVKSLLLHDSLPDGYQPIAKFEKSIRLKDRFVTDDRCYIVVSVNQVPHIYLVDTGLQRAELKMPMADSVKTKHLLRYDSVSSMVGTYEARIDGEAWVDFGNRSGSKKVFYFDNSEDGYLINPLNVFTQDLVIDIDGGQILLRPKI